VIQRRLHVSHEKWPLKEPFHISRGLKTDAHVVKVELEHCAIRGRGEATPYARYGETIDSVMDQIEAMRDALEEGTDPQALQGLLPAGAARNAVDCALWDLMARWKGVTVSDLLHFPRPKGVETAVTIGIDDAAAMADKARLYKEYPLLKIKLDRQDVRGKITAIRQQAPRPRIIIDPNESWTLDDLAALDDFLAEMRIDLLEQPLAAGADEGLRDFRGKIPICADESCHTRRDLDGLLGKYQLVNIKLDKTGGLTEAVKLKHQAREMGFEIMIGCMVATSLAMVPALLLAAGARFVDLDGPLWMRRDRENGLTFDQGRIVASDRALWGG